MFLDFPVVGIQYIYNNIITPMDALDISQYIYIYI